MEREGELDPCLPARRAVAAARRIERLAGDLTSTLDDIVFTIEHGVPGEVLARLDEIVAALVEIETPDPDRTERLRRAAIDLDEAKRAMWRADPAATDSVLRRGRGILDVLRNENRGSNP